MWAITLKLLKGNWKSFLLIVVLSGGGVWLGTLITQSQLSDQALAFSKENRRLSASLTRKNHSGIRSVLPPRTSMRPTLKMRWRRNKPGSVKLTK